MTAGLILYPSQLVIRTPANEEPHNLYCSFNMLVIKTKLKNGVWGEKGIQDFGRKITRKYNLRSEGVNDDIKMDLSELD